LTAALVALGCGGRAYCYFLDPSLNHDDAALALNILQRTAAGLRDSLDYDQLAPWGFLLIERAAVNVGGASEYSLRLPPLLAGLATVPAFWYLAHHRLPLIESVLATGFFSFAQDLTTSVIQVKQYSVELLATILVLIVTRPVLDGSSPRRRWMLAAVGGAVAIWFSFTAVFVLAGIGLAALIGRTKSHDVRKVVMVGAVWISAGLLYATTVLRYQMRGSSMFGIWQHEFLPSAVSQWPTWLLNRFLSLGSVSTSTRLAPLAAAALVFAIWLAFASRRRFSIALALILLITLGAGALGVYPFIGRLLFFAVPVALLLMFGEIGSWARTRTPAVRRVIVAGTAVALLYAYVSFTNRIFINGPDFDDPRGVYADIRGRLDADDAIYVSAAAQPSMRYYAPDLASRQIAANAWPEHARVWFVFFEPTERDFDKRVVHSARRTGVTIESATRRPYTATMWRLNPTAGR
jgi:hypothetical protein